LIYVVCGENLHNHIEENFYMDNKLFSEKWSVLQPKIKQKWSKFTDQDLKMINGDKNKFLTDLQKKYGIDKNVAEKELKTLSDSLVGAGAGGKPGASTQPPKKPGTPPANNQGRPNKK
jgi:uncharacterized protein YjbJ (UPF0337 family)